MCPSKSVVMISRLTQLNILMEERVRICILLVDLSSISTTQNEVIWQTTSLHTSHQHSLIVRWIKIRGGERARRMLCCWMAGIEDWVIVQRIHVVFSIHRGTGFLICHWNNIYCSCCMRTVEIMKHCEHVFNSDLHFARKEKHESSKVLERKYTTKGSFWCTTKLFFR